MDILIIIVLGFIFSTISKSVKDKKETDKEKMKRKEELRARGNQASRSFDIKDRPKTNNKTRSFKEIFMDEIKKVEGSEGSLGELLRKSLGEDEEDYAGRSNEPRKEEFESSADYASDDAYVSEEEYSEQEGYRNIGDALSENYMEKSSIEDNNEITKGEIIPGKSRKIRKKTTTIEKPITTRTLIDNRQYNPFSKSLNKKDVIRGVIFSEVLEKPKSLRK